MGDEGKRARRLARALVSLLLVGTKPNLAGAQPEPPPGAAPGEVRDEPPEPPPTEPAPDQPAPLQPERPADEPGATPQPAPAPSDDGPSTDPYPPLPSQTGATTVTPQRYQGPFAQGRLRLSILLGGGTNFDDDYLILGGGVGYYLVNGLELAVDGSAWLIGDPFLATVTPGLTYVFVMVPQVHPYLGAFYRHYFISDGFDDFDTYGGRGGVYLTIGNNGFVGAGVVYERRFDCDDNVLWRDCDQWYPEVTVAFVF